MTRNSSSLRPVLYARSVAILGASGDLNKIGGRTLKYLLKLGYRGKIFPVNPRYPEIAGVPCYPSVGAVGDEIDLAVVAVPASQVLSALVDCVEHRVKSAIIYSSDWRRLGKRATPSRAIGWR